MDQDKWLKLASSIELSAHKLGLSGQILIRGGICYRPKLFFSDLPSIFKAAYIELLVLFTAPVTEVDVNADR